MMRRLSKWFQRRVLDAVLHDPPPVFAVVILALTSVFVLGYWSAQSKGEIVLPGYGLHGVFADNIAGRSYYDVLGSGILPMDVVYTWVNGSDPILVSGLRSLLRTISGQCSPPHYCAQARYVAAPLRSSFNITHLTSVIQATPRLAGALAVTAQTGLEGSSDKQFVLARVMSPRPEEEQEVDDGFERPDGVNDLRPPLPRRMRGVDRGASSVDTTPSGMSDVDEVVSDLQRRLSEAGIEVVASQALWSTERNHGWSIPRDTAAFVISSSKQDVNVMYHKLTHSIPEFDQSCDRQVVPNGFFVECIDKLLIDDLREAVILYNTPQTDDLMQARDARVHASLHNNVPVLATPEKDAGLSRRSGGGAKEVDGEGRKRSGDEGKGDLVKGSVEAADERMDGGDEDLHGRRGRVVEGGVANLRKSLRKNANDRSNMVGRRDGTVDDGGVDNNSRRLGMQRKLQSVTDVFPDESSQSKPIFFNDNFVGDFEGKDYNGVNHSDKNSFDVLDSLRSNASSHRFLLEKVWKNRSKGIEFYNEMINLEEISSDNSQVPKSNIRRLMVLGGRFQHKRSKELFDNKAWPNATLGPIDKSDRALAFRIGDNRLDAIKSFIDNDHPDPLLQNDVKLVENSNALPRSNDVKDNNLHQTTTTRPSRSTWPKRKNGPRIKTHLSYSAAASKSKSDLLGPMTSTPKPGKRPPPVRKNKMLVGSEEEVMAKGPLQFLPAFLLLQIIENDKLRESVSVNRFQDSEELRYSLRSLERYAGWVRHVYLVTNGQLPHWLNLDHPRLTVVTHETIFPDKSHLPTYSSPAIESHLHKIPGLSRQFLYLNDDVLLGAPVWPHDFHTPDEGQKVYLSWPLPNCASGCAYAWLSDGYCDMPCNVSLCNYDGGDCFGDVSMGVGFGPDGDDFGRHLDSMYDDYESGQQCSDGCHSNWLADGYCDALCNMASCGYDCGDCGLGYVHTLHQLPPPKRNTSHHVALPPNTVSWWIDFSALLTPNHTIEGDYFVTHLGGGSSAPYAVPASGEQERSGYGVLSLIASTQLRLVVAVMQHNFTNAILLKVKIKHTSNGSLDWCNYNISYNASVKTASPLPIPNVQDELQQQEVARLHFNFTRMVPREVEDTKLKKLKETLAAGVDQDDAYHNVDAKSSTFDMSVVEQIQQILGTFLQGDITVEGLKSKKHWIIKEYLLQNPSKRTDLVYLDAEWIDNLTHSLGFAEVSSNQTSAHLVERDDLVVAGNRKLLWMRNSYNGLKLFNDINSLNSFKTNSNSADNIFPNNKTSTKFVSRSVSNDIASDCGLFNTYRGNLPWEKIKIFDRAAGTRDFPGGFDWDVIARTLDVKMVDYYEGVDSSISVWDDPTLADAPEWIEPHEGGFHELKQRLAIIKDTFYETLSSLARNFISFMKYIPNKAKNSNFEKSDPYDNFADSNLDSKSDMKFLMSGLTAPTTEGSPELELDPSVEFMAPGRRRVLNNFDDSLIYVNRLYNEKLGIRVRKVPAHVPHFINSTVMEQLQQRFATEFAETSSHRVRHSRDMQYAFSYYYFMLGATRQRSLEEVFQEFDTDHSGTWSDRELRTLLSRLAPVPVQYSRVQHLHSLLHNCSLHHPLPPVPTPPYERYADSTLPPITLALIERCMNVQDMLVPLRTVPRFQVSEQSDSSLHFKMISSNLSKVVTLLDEVRQEPRKFVCLNNNLDPEGSDNSMILALLQDTYEALYPDPSTFELPLNFRNRFLYVHELEAWRTWRDAVRIVVYSCFAVLVFISVCSFWGTSIQNCRRRWCQRRRRPPMEKVIVSPV